VPCPSLSDFPPMAKIAKPAMPSMPSIGAERLVITVGAPDANEEKIIDENLNSGLLHKIESKTDFFFTDGTK